ALRNRFKPAARVVVDLLLADQAVAVAVDDDVVRAQPLRLARPIEMDAYERRRPAADDGERYGPIDHVLETAHREGDELERALDAFDARRPIEQPDGWAEIHHIRVIQRPGDFEIAAGKRLSEAAFLCVELGRRDHDPLSNSAHCSAESAAASI